MYAASGGCHATATTSAVAKTSPMMSAGSTDGAAATAPVTHANVDTATSAARASFLGASVPQRESMCLIRRKPPERSTHHVRAAP